MNIVKPRLRLNTRGMLWTRRISDNRWVFAGKIADGKITLVPVYGYVLEKNARGEA